LRPAYFIGLGVALLPRALLLDGSAVAATARLVVEGYGNLFGVNRKALMVGREALSIKPSAKKCDAEGMAIGSSRASDHRRVLSFFYSHRGWAASKALVLDC